MSYLHCPACSRAYNLATHPSCPHCPVVGVPVDPAEDLAAAVETFARALARATPAQRAAATASIEGLGLAAGRSTSGDRAGWEPIRNALMPAPSPPPRPRALLAAVAIAVLDRVASHAPGRLVRAVHARVKALAA